MAAEQPAYRLVRPAATPVMAPVLDPSQQAVVDHSGGPLVVLAGPGTGKTTTLVEAVVDRVERGGLTPDQVLVLTFSRRAAVELRGRIGARLGRTTAEPAAATFHSFCYALVGEHLRPERTGPEQFAEPPRLLSGPEQELAVRELLAGQLAEGSASGWPVALRPALATRGFAGELRQVVARSRELGLDPDELARYAKAEGRDDWGAAAGFLAEYLDVLDARGALDYAELVHRAVLLAERPDVQTELRARYAAVFVDEYQDTDRAQARLLRALAGGGRDLVVVGDPDQSIYAFRGADVHGLLDAPHSFPQVDGSPAPVLTLRRSRRAGPLLLGASRAVASRLTITTLPATKVSEHRALEAGPGTPAGRLDVFTFPSAGAELDAIADTLRRAHLEDGLPWSQMAVLVRSGVRSVPLLRRVLGASGVPLEVAGDELPLAQEPAVAPLLLALECAARPEALTAEVAHTLLLSPLAGADAGEVRRLGRALRAWEREEVAGLHAEIGQPDRGPLPSDELVRRAIAEPGRLIALDDRVTRPARQLAALLASAREKLADERSPDDALWALWSGSGWPRRLERAALRGGAAGRAADRDLDAVCALFDAAARVQERSGRQGARDLAESLRAQQIPGDTLAERPVRGDAVRLLTAHRAKGLEWRLVVVCGLQEGVWPDLRLRGSTLQADRIDPDGLTAPPTTASTLAEERRLFYVAITRARERLLVTAVDSGEDDGERPSRFLRELGVPVQTRSIRPSRPLSMPGLVAELRSSVVDPEIDEPQRAAATDLLAALAAATDELGDPLVPAADPSSWWGLLETSDPGASLRDPDEPLRLSGSSLTGLTECALRWFLAHEVHAEGSRSGALGFGSVVHALADDVAKGGSPADSDALMARLDRVWSQLAFDAPWKSRQEHDEARRAVERFLRWHGADRARELLASEHRFEVSLDDGGQVLLRGSMDRVERDDDGLVHVVDFKTGRSGARPMDVPDHPQLGVYQLAVARGGVDELIGEAAPARSGGAELVQLRLEAARTPGQPLVQKQDAPEPGPDGRTWVDELVSRAAVRVLAEDFRPTPNERCPRCEFRRSCPAVAEGEGVVT